MTSLTTLNLLDVLIRMMVLGQLLLLGGLLLREPASVTRHLLLAAGISVGGLVMLTAPVPDEQYGLLRNLLLILTDAFAFVFWLLIRHQFDDDFRPSRWPWPIKVTLALFAIVYVYALGVQAGNTHLHDLIHAVGLMLILHAGYIAARGFVDDLLDTRRRARIVVVLIISVYSMVLVIFEFADERYRNADVFGLINAALLLLATTLAVVRLFRLRYEPVQRLSLSPDSAAEPGKVVGVTPDAEPLLSPVDIQLAQALDTFIAERGYHQNALTITTLARQLDCQEHRLRRLINQTRGYRNFNAMLNDLRIADAMDRLSDPACDSTPILSIALGLGYDSIGPFNRAFKSKTEQKPGEFRRGVQNRR